MDLRRGWWRFAFGRPHVFVLPWPGATPVRLAVEAFLRENGWPVAMSPADTDILLVTAPAEGDLSAQLSELAERVWVGVAAPRVRLTITDPARVEPDLLEGLSRLADPSGQLPSRPDAGEDGGSPHDVTPAHGGMDHSGMDHSGMDHSGMDHSGMDHSGMDMPAGLPLAREGVDRDGLSLDILRIALGPALPYWPAGLRLMLTVQGDVVIEAAVEVPELSRPQSSWWSSDRSGVDSAARTAARRLDSLSRLFAIAGADRLALASAGVRDHLLAGAGLQSVAPDVVHLHRRATHSPLLASMTRRVPLDPDGTLLGLPAPGDVWLRLTRWLEETTAALAGDKVSVEPDTGTLLSALPRLVVGRELAEVRLVVAALDPDLDEPTVPVAGPTWPAMQAADVDA